jgi:hypothetical protein
MEVDEDDENGDDGQDDDGCVLVLCTASRMCTHLTATCIVSLAV